MMPSNTLFGVRDPRRMAWVCLACNENLQHFLGKHFNTS